MTAQIIRLSERRAAAPKEPSLTGWPLADAALLMNPFALLTWEMLKRAEKNATVVPFPGGIDDLPV